MPSVSSFRARKHDECQERDKEMQEKDGQDAHDHDRGDKIWSRGNARMTKLRHTRIRVLCSTSDGGAIRERSLNPNTETYTAMQTTSDKELPTKST